MGKRDNKFEGEQTMPHGKITIYWQETPREGWYVTDHNEDGPEFDEGPYDTSDNAMRDHMPYKLGDDLNPNP